MEFKGEGVEKIMAKKGVRFRLLHLKFGENVLELLQFFEPEKSQGETPLAHARAVIEAWRVQYNTARPHPALGYKAPAAYLATRAASRKLRKDSAQLPFRSMITTENSQPTWPYTRGKINMV